MTLHYLESNITPEVTRATNHMSNPNPNPVKPGPGRPKGSKNATPGERQLMEYRRQLRAAADEGDIQAMAWVLLINAVSPNQ